LIRGIRVCVTPYCVMYLMGDLIRGIRVCV